MTKRRTNRVLAAVLTALLLGAATIPTQAAQSSEKEKVSAPEAVMTAFHKAYPVAKIMDVSTETKDSVTYFEIESTDAGLRRDLLYRADGALFEIEEAIAVDSLPDTVIVTLKASFPDGKLQKAERIMRGKMIEYEVTIENGETGLEILLDSTGTIKSQAVISDLDEKNESGEKDESDED